MTLGKNTVNVRVGGRREARLELTNHPTTGPIFSGPQQRPFVCETEAAGLGVPLDGNCSAPTVVTYVYKSTAPAPAGTATDLVGAGREAAPRTDPLPAGFRPYDADGGRPADIAQTTTSDGSTVDYIVRRERGTINRAIFEIAFLHVPGQQLPDPWTTTPGWNRRLVYPSVAAARPATGKDGMSTR